MYFADTSRISVGGGRYPLGHWGEWKQCPERTLATAIKVRTHILKLDLEDGAPFFAIGGATLASVRRQTEEQTGLTDLILVCEDGTELVSHSELVSKNRVGHLYQSNEVDCSNYYGNFIRGIRMKYDKEKDPKNEATMIHNFAIACTRDFDRDVRKNYAMRTIPEIPGGILKS